jgi:ABC-type multidrug transport system ATPase subunit
LPDYLLKFDNVNFSYRNTKVYENFDLKIDRPQLISVVGSNGSGKSTLLKLAVGLLQPQSGEVTVLGKHPLDMDIKAQMGSSLQDISFPSSERVEEVLGFIQKQYRNPLPLEEVVEKFFLQDFRKKPCGQLSGGMKRRLSLACAIIGQPKALFLDEPTTGLDQKSRNKLLQNLKDYQKSHQALIMVISHHPGEMIEAVDCFFHVKGAKVSLVSPEKMNELTKLKKISFESHQTFEMPEAIRLRRSGSSYEVVVVKSDHLVRELCRMEFPFKNLEIESLSADELIEEIL